MDIEESHNAMLPGSDFVTRKLTCPLTQTSISAENTDL